MVRWLKWLLVIPAVLFFSGVLFHSLYLPTILILGGYSSFLYYKLGLVKWSWLVFFSAIVHGVSLFYLGGGHSPNMFGLGIFCLTTIIFVLAPNHKYRNK